MLPEEEVLAGRFRIVRFIADGGMGRVYEADDLRLRERVALKTLRPFLATSLVAQERFRREVQLARRVTHPNVCRIFDLGIHPHPHPLAFVTMELLHGETLGERLRRKGRMTLAEALPLVEQMAAALSAAHAAGVVHRDFKSANFMLVPTEGGDRAVVTDFGLARSADGDDAGVTSSGAAVGTLSYMAPEQFAGDTATPQTDIYAFGVVMYEMAAGVRPFDNVGPRISGVMRRLSQPATSPRHHAPDVDRRWARVILRCLERDPACRFRSAGDVARALRGEPVAGSPRIPRLAWASAGLVAVLAAGGAFVSLTRTPAPAHARPAAVRRSVAVMGFQNLSGRPEAAWLSVALAEMLSAELGTGEHLRTVAGETVARTRHELALPTAPAYSPETLGRIRANLAADVVVIGSYLAVARGAGADIRLDVHVQDANAGETVTTISETGAEAELLTLVSRVGARLRHALGAPARSSEEVRAVEAALPTSPQAARLYAEGLAQLRALDALAARDLLQQAVEADPRFPLAHAALAKAWARLGYEGRARDAAEKAYALSGELSREHRLVVEGGYREATRDWPRAVEIYRALAAFFPDDLDYGLRLAAAQTAAGQGREALATLRGLRALPAPAGDDPQIDLAEAAAASSLGEFRLMHAAARRAAEKGAARGARLLHARARAAEATASRHVGDYRAAASAARGAQRIFRDAGDVGGLAWALHGHASVLRNEGDLRGSRQLQEEALALFRRIGDQRGSAQALSNLGATVVFQGGLREARALWEQALAINREIGDRQQVAYQLNNLGSVDRELGNLKDARRELEEALAICAEIGEANTPRAIHYALGLLHHDRGDLAGARQSLEQSRAAAEKSRERRFLAFATAGLADLDLAEGRLAEGRRGHEQALTLREQLGEKLTAAASRLALAAVALEEGDAVGAEAMARAAGDVFAREKVVHDEALARAMQVTALLASGRIAEAQAVADHAAELPPVESVQRRASTSLAVARLLAADGRLAEAQAHARKTAEEADRVGLVPWRLQARLTLGEMLLQTDARAAAGVLRRVQAEAHRAGFVLLARKAERALGG